MACWYGTRYDVKFRRKFALWLSVWNGAVWYCGEEEPNEDGVKSGKTC